jgi:hypothetical protein
MSGKMFEAPDQTGESTKKGVLGGLSPVGERVELYVAAQAPTTHRKVGFDIQDQSSQSMG